MSNTEDLSAALDKLIACGNGLIKVAEALKVFCNLDEVTPPKAQEAEVTSTEDHSYSKEDVRSLLAQKANDNDGQYRVAVKDLVKKYANGGTLTDVHPECYPALVADLEKLGNA